VHPRHIDAFLLATEKHRCHILVRKTGKSSLQYFGQSGYTGKRADMKAKTAIRNSSPYQIEGLVCSPLIHPGACKPGALEEWRKSAHLVTIPPAGFDDDHQPRGCHTPYMLQTNRNHRHYGCIAWVENGLLTPRYVHGDYDLYLIIPAGHPFVPADSTARKVPMGATMDPPTSLTLLQRLQRQAELDAHAVTDLVGPLSTRVGTFLNLEIAKKEPGFLGAMMVNHGEHVLQGAASQDYQDVLAFNPEERGGSRARILHNQTEHQEYYRNA